MIRVTFVHFTNHRTNKFAFRAFKTYISGIHGTNKGRASFDIFHELLIYKTRHGTEVIIGGYAGSGFPKATRVLRHGRWKEGHIKGIGTKTGLNVRDTSFKS
jgi:hypothetical protein